MLLNLGSPTVNVCPNDDPEWWCETIPDMGPQCATKYECKGVLGLGCKWVGTPVNNDGCHSGKS